MAAKRTRATKPTSPLVRARASLGSIDSAAMVGELRQMHENAEDPRIERMPDDAELYGALVYAERHASALDHQPEPIRAKAALTRTVLWQYLREQIDAHQLRAIDASRAANVEWAALARALAVNSPSAAYNKAQRLRATVFTGEAALGGRPVRRTPEAAVDAQRRIEAAAIAERKRQEAADKRHDLVQAVAHRLIGHRDELVRDPDADDWLEEIEAVLGNCHTPTQKISLATYLRAAVRALRSIERHTGRPVAATPEGLAAFEAADEVVRDH
ncbi:hypothetical protein [Streptomyces sp. NBC_00467]|uniref:hypothetical protein n=1 Tax=Streptomyces sp. NBC_00467 TaxID=2975752 RepID=UPI002E198811